MQVGFGLGFYTFVLQGFMRSIPDEIQQAALIDGAGVVRSSRIILPMTRPRWPRCRAGVHLDFNDLLWAITVLRTGTVMPVTRRCSACRGSTCPTGTSSRPGSVIAAIPTVAVFLRFQKHFISGLAIGAVK